MQATTNQANLHRAFLLRDPYIYGARYAIRFSIIKIFWKKKIVYFAQKNISEPFRQNENLTSFLAKKFFLKINKIRKGQIPNTIRIPARHILFTNTRLPP